MLTTKGPGDGLSPTMLRYILEKQAVATKDIEEDVVIYPDDISLDLNHICFIFSGYFLSISLSLLKL